MAAVAAPDEGASPESPPPAPLSVPDVDLAREFDHVKVAIRCKPLSEEEKKNVQIVIKTDGDKLIAFYPESKEGLLYNYDYFFPESSGQADLYQVVGTELVDLVMQGYNSCCLSYGPSSGGKTHTLFGSDTEHGLIQLTTAELFRRIESAPPTKKSEVSVSYWEMSGDEARDALNLKDPDRPMEVRKNNTLGVYIPGLTEESVCCWEELDELLMRGNLVRIRLSKARTARWHGFLRVRVVQTDSEAPDTILSSTLTFVHLKGPDRVGQRGATGSVLKQGSSINRSISLLGAAMLQAVDLRRRKLSGLL
eukprot:RCo027306